MPAAAFEAPTTKQYSEAFAKLEANDVTAMPAFAALVGQHADDALAGFHLRRLLNGGKGVLQLDNRKARSFSGSARLFHASIVQVIVFIAKEGTGDVCGGAIS